MEVSGNIDCNTQPKYIDVYVSEELANDLSNEAIIPLYEKKVHEYKQMKNSSLVTNKLLHCRWRERIKNIGAFQRVPFEFPHLGDFHFSNCSVKFKPSESITNRITNRYQMSTGPKTDAYGQIPIPNDMHVRQYYKTGHRKAT